MWRSSCYGFDTVRLPVRCRRFSAAGVPPSRDAAALGAACRVRDSSDRRCSSRTPWNACMKREVHRASSSDPEETVSVPSGCAARRRRRRTASRCGGIRTGDRLMRVRPSGETLTGREVATERVSVALTCICLHFQSDTVGREGKHSGARWLHACKRWMFTFNRFARANTRGTRKERVDPALAAPV